MRMQESNCLKIGGFPFAFGHLERLFVANVLHIKMDCHVDCRLDNESFVAAVNRELGKTKERRKDDRLRFIYKRAIKIMLAKATQYQQNKSCRMENYAANFIKHYFKDQAGVEDVLNTSYASCKKLKHYFVKSPAFQRDFVDHALDQIVKEYSANSLDAYSKMLDTLVKQKHQTITSATILKRRYKRLPWS